VTRFRPTIRTVARLALVVLAAQFASSLAHAAPLRPSPPQPSAKHDTNRCDICAIFALADRVMLSTPPLLMLPEAVEFLYVTTDAEFVHLKSASEAPPPRGQHAS
jgi:hypothetical protein